MDRRATIQLAGGLVVIVAALMLGALRRAGSFRDGSHGGDGGGIRAAIAINWIANENQRAPTRSHEKACEVTHMPCQKVVIEKWRFFV